MAGRSTGPERRRGPQQRFRQGFLNQAAERLRDFAQLLADEPESSESVAFELRRLSETAVSLQLDTIARATEEAAVELAAHPDAAAPRVLRRVANAIRRTVGRLRFGPLVIVGAPSEAAARVADDAQFICEPVQLYEDLPAFAAGLHTEQPVCVVLPVAAIDAVQQLARRERFPVLVHGPASAWEQRLTAMEVGASGFLLHPFDLRDVTRLARWRAHTPPSAWEVLLLADEDEARDQLAAAMEQVGIAVVTAGDPAELALALEAGTPRAVVLGPEVAGRPALALARMVRGHPRCNHVPVIVCGRPDDAAALRAAGVDDVIRRDAAAAQAAQRVRDRVARLAALPWERDPVSGLANRLGTLDALDHELARCSRTGSVLAVALIDIEGLGGTVERFGAGVYRNARRHLSDLLREGLRRTDLYGELAAGELAVAFPGCDRATGQERVDAIGEAFRKRCLRDTQLMDLRFVVGVADTQLGVPGVARRAELELRARSQGA